MHSDRLSSLHFRICFKPVKKIILRLFNLAELAIDELIYTCTSILHVKLSTKKLSLLGGSLSSCSSNVAPKIGFAHYFTSSLFSKGSCNAYRKNAFSILLQCFYFIILEFKKSSKFVKCNTYCYISFDTYKNFFCEIECFKCMSYSLK